MQEGTDLVDVPVPGPVVTVPGPTVRVAVTPPECANVLNTLAAYETAVNAMSHAATDPTVAAGFEFQAYIDRADSTDKAAADAASACVAAGSGKTT